VKLLNNYYRKSFEALGSVFEIELIGDDGQDLVFLVGNYQQKIAVFEQKFSRFLVGSELSKLNNLLNNWVEVSSEMLNIIQMAEKYKEITDGYFDIGVESVLGNLGYGTVQRENLPDVLKIEFKDGNKIRINKPIDFGGLGKGLVLDWAKEVFGDVANVCVNAGGDFYFKGKDKEQKSWKVFFENPFDVEEVIGLVEIGKEIFLAASNTLKRKWSGGHHLINPKNLGVASEMAGVYVQADQGEKADVFSTALFAMGYEKAKQWVQKNQLVEVMLISLEGAVFKTEGFEGKLNA
jgi:thiamine biosynthesis lipoprotein